MKRPLHRWHHSIGSRFRSEPVFDGGYRNSCIEDFRKHSAQATQSAARSPSSTMNKQEHRSWLFGFRLPEVNQLLGMRAIRNVVLSRLRKRWIRRHEPLRFVLFNLPHKDISPPNLPAVSLQHNGPRRRQRLRTIPKVFHDRAFDNSPRIQPHPGPGTDLPDLDLIPLSEWLVCNAHGITPQGIWCVVKKPSRSQVRATGRLLRIENLIFVPDLDLRRSPKIDSAVRPRHRFVLQKKLHITEILLSRGIRAMAIVDQLSVFDPPVIGKFSPHFPEGRILLFPFQLGHRMRVQAIPAGEIFAIEEGDPI